MSDVSTEPDESRPLPAWVSIVLIILCLSVGGWIVHWYVNGDPLSHESKILDPNAAGIPPRAVRGRRAVTGVQPRGRDGWIVRAPDASMLIIQPKGKPAKIHTVDYNNYEFVPAEERKLIFTARRLARDQAVGKALNLTTEQLRQLRPLMSQVNMALAPADAEKLIAAWAAYQAAKDKKAAEDPLMGELDAVARRSLDQTLKAASERAAKIKAVLTADQWKQFDAMGK